MELKTIAASVLCLSLLWSGTASADAKGEITQTQATTVVKEAMKRYHPGVSVDLMPSQSDAGFYDFEATSGNPTGSPVVGHFSVNKSSGDVWDVAGHCKHLSSASIQKTQKEIRKKLGHDEQFYLQARSKKPECDAD